MDQGIGAKWNTFGAILPRSIFPHSAVLPQHNMFRFAPAITFGDTHYVN